jgi:hypothetical protein
MSNENVLPTYSQLATAFYIAYSELEEFIPFDKTMQDIYPKIYQMRQRMHTHRKFGNEMPNPSQE